MNSVFSEQILADKLSKLNGTQQCIETLSHWCIFHQSKAELVVTTWDKQFHSSSMVQKVPLLYLANDILQNSKRKGNEFVTEFWKVLPSALKDVVEKGDDHGKKVVSRLVNIWEERRVFGSRGRSLKDVMLAAGDVPPPPLEFSGKKRSRSVRIVKRDSRSIRTKLSIGGAAEKIVSAYHLVLSERPSEEEEMAKCKSGVHRVRKMEKEVDVVCTIAEDPKRKSLASELEKEEHLLKQCIEKLKSVEANRVALVSQLKEALHEEESELENVRTQMQVAQGQAEEACNMRKRLNDEDHVSKLSTMTTPSVDTNTKAGQTPKRTAAAIAAEVADKLTASSSSQMIMHSVLSTFAAEEAKNAGLVKASTSSNSFTSIPVNSVTDAIAKSEKPMAISDPNKFLPAQSLTVPPNQSYQTILVPQPTLPSQASTSQAQYHMLSNPPPQQYMQPSGGIMTPFGYSSISSMPAGPPPPHMVSPMVPLVQQPIPLAQQPAPMNQQIPMLTQQPPAPPSFRPLQPPGLVYYGHPPHS
ncbi:regulation of nuclear pre-mRNA domain-containing protein 1B-like [Mangifera indica]|uniref:regulation of nuclear pre-mRNA domain-containing protein 1B-like n=1 Tax=Mangifera indica TaxID=29780 RepID=UPI001CFB1334|nr:regulation of nuclear pre-mRNA domain-containing protein 1B-like [Mangifera indica]